jgi:predicted transcriptional regulator of viral defense system
MNYPNIDDLFMEEMNNHNNIIAMSSNLQQSLTTVTRFGLDITTFISDVVDCIQRKDYDNAAKILTNAVYSIDQLAVELGKISSSIQQGVLKVYEQKSEGFEELF